MDFLFKSATHKNIWFEDVEHSLAVQANQHMIVHGEEAIILDPGGHKAFKQGLAGVSSQVTLGQLKHIFLSHQDPDIVAAVNGWLMTTDATAWCSELWIRFVPHFGMDRLVEDRLRPIPDQGMVMMLDQQPLYILPAHFLHSVGNFHIYDPVAKILYSGDMGASLHTDQRFVYELGPHIPYLERMHTRYMACNKAMQAWVGMVSKLDIEIIAPQHGAAICGKPAVKEFLDWCEHLACGIDLMEDIYKLPSLTEGNQP